MKGNSIYIRILEKEDIPQTQKWITSPEISDIMGYLPVLSLHNQLIWYEKIAFDNSRYIFAICLNDTNEHIGNIGLGNINYVHRHAMLNIFIAQNNMRKKGLGTEATLLLLDFAFKRINMNKIYLQTSARFEEAIRMYRKIGFVQEGVMRQHYYTNGHYEDKLIFSILKSEYLHEQL